MSLIQSLRSRPSQPQQYNQNLHKIRSLGWAKVEKIILQKNANIIAADSEEGRTYPYNGQALNTLKSFAKAWGFDLVHDYVYHSIILLKKENARTSRRANEFQYSLEEVLKSLADNGDATSIIEVEKEEEEEEGVEEGAAHDLETSLKTTNAQVKEAAQVLTIGPNVFCRLILELAKGGSQKLLAIQLFKDESLLNDDGKLITDNGLEKLGINSNNAATRESINTVLSNKLSGWDEDLLNEVFTGPLARAIYQNLTVLKRHFSLD